MLVPPLSLHPIPRMGYEHSFPSLPGHIFPLGCCLCLSASTCLTSLAGPRPARMPCLESYGCCLSVAACLLPLARAWGEFLTTLNN